MKVQLKTILQPYWHIHRLQQGKIYTVIEISSQRYRLISDEDGKPYLYDKRAFDIIEHGIPSDWLYHVETYDKGEPWADPDVPEMYYQDFVEEYWLSPRCFSQPHNFFERYHDDDPECVRIFNRYVEDNLD